jgi:DNA-binding response OmpR family regulator
MLLIVDPDPAWRELLADFFGLHSMETLHAPSGEEAIRALSSGPDLIILNLALPDIRGIELVRKIHGLSSGAAPPVLALGGTTLSSAEETLLSGRLKKPVNLEELLSRVKDRLKSVALPE